MTIHDTELTARLVETVLSWKVTPDRLVMLNRRWIPRWRFNPLGCLDDAFKLLEAAGAEYQITGAGNIGFHAAVQIGNKKAMVKGTDKPRAIVMALAAALGLAT